MRAWMLRAPWWALALVSGGCFTLGMVLFDRVQGAPWSEALAGTWVAGLVFGLVMGPWIARQNRRARETVGTASAAGVRGAARAAWRGPLPDDPEERAAAYRMAVLQRDQLVRQRPWAIPFLAGMLVLALWLALDDSPWWWLAVLLWVAALAGHLLMPRRLARRAEQLRAPEGTPS